MYRHQLVRCLVTPLFQDFLSVSSGLPSVSLLWFQKPLMMKWKSPYISLSTEDNAGVVSKMHLLKLVINLCFLTSPSTTWMLVQLVSPFIITKCKILFIGWHLQAPTFIPLDQPTQCFKCFVLVRWLTELASGAISLQIKLNTIKGWKKWRQSNW